MFSKILQILNHLMLAEPSSHHEKEREEVLSTDCASLTVLDGMLSDVMNSSGTCLTPVTVSKARYAQRCLYVLWLHCKLIMP